VACAHAFMRSCPADRQRDMRMMEPPLRGKGRATKRAPYGKRGSGGAPLPMTLSYRAIVAPICRNAGLLSQFVASHSARPALGARPGGDEQAGGMAFDIGGVPHPGRVDRIFAGPQEGAHFGTLDLLDQGHA